MHQDQLYRRLVRRLMNSNLLQGEERFSAVEILSFPDATEIGWRAQRLFERLASRGALSRDERAGDPPEIVRYRHNATSAIWEFPIPGEVRRPEEEVAVGPGPEVSREASRFPSGPAQTKVDSESESDTLFDPEGETVRTMLAALATNLTLEEIEKALHPIRAQVMGRTSANEVIIHLLRKDGSLEAIFPPSDGGPLVLNEELAHRLLVEGRSVGLEEESRRLFPPSLLLPLAWESNVFGVLEIRRVPHQSFSRAELDLFRFAAAASAATLAKAQRLERELFLDRLTGLYNRSYFEDHIHREIARLDRTNAGIEEGRGEQLALLMCDLDNFRSINNDHGHPVGDAALTQVGAAILSQIRKIDVASRYGGEEFVIILPPSISESAALQAAERLRRTVETTNFGALDPRLRNIRLSISIGLALYPDDAERIEPATLVKRADDALLKAKDLGKNRVVVWRRPR